MRAACARMGAERGQDDPWTPDLVAEVERQRRELLPLELWPERVAWRDRRLMALARAKASLDSDLPAPLARTRNADPKGEG